MFVYTDLMLVTREDEPGRCNVLQSPLYLRQLRLQDGMLALTHPWLTGRTGVGLTDSFGDFKVTFISNRTILF